MFLGSPNGSFKSEPYRKPASVHYSGCNTPNQLFLLGVSRNHRLTWLQETGHPLVQILRAPQVAAARESHLRSERKANLVLGDRHARFCHKLTSLSTRPAKPLQALFP